MNHFPNNTEKLLEELKNKSGFPSIFEDIFGNSRSLFNQKVLTLMDYGWYISGDIELKKISNAFNLINDGKAEEAEKIITSHFKKNLRKIETNLISKHKEREVIFKEAFKAHKRKMYFSATILFLSQGDGIMDGKIFHNRNNLEKHLDKKKNPDFVGLLKNDSPLNVPSIKIKQTKYFSKLNRHSVMHGGDNEYGTEINSLKALSLCTFANDWYNRY